MDSEDRDNSIVHAGENSRTRASWQRRAALAVAVVLHIGLLLLLPYMINRSEPPTSEAVEVAIVPPPRPPPKLVSVTPAVRPAEKNSSAGRPHLQPAPRLAHISQPRFHLPIPDPLLPKPPMSLPVASGSSAAGAPGNGSGGAGNGAGNGSQEGNDYLIRLKAYIDSHRGRARHREPYDADVELVLDPDGMLTDIHVVSSSGDPRVDDEIVMQLRGMSPFPRPPPVLFSASKPLLPVVDKWIFPRP